METSRAKSTERYHPEEQNSDQVDQADNENDEINLQANENNMVGNTDKLFICPKGIIRNRRPRFWHKKYSSRTT